MQGTVTDPGVNVRALNELFQIRDERSQDNEYTIRISLLEIYLDKIIDLMNGQVCRAQNTGHGMEVIDLTIIDVNDSQSVLQALAQGSKNRKVTSTAMNDASSRSHLILTVYVSGKNRLSGKETFSKMHLIDLAGRSVLSMIDCIVLACI
jgi:kinesin family member C2/C3